MSETKIEALPGQGQVVDDGQRRLTGTVSDLPGEELLRRAVLSARDPHANGVPKPLWHHVMRRFALGSTYAAQLCRRFGLDPDEIVDRKR